MMPAQSFPHWQLTSIYSGLDSSEYVNAKVEMKNKMAALENFMDEYEIRSQKDEQIDDAIGTVLTELLERINDLYTQLGLTQLKN